MKLTIGRLVFWDYPILFKKWKKLIQHGSFNNLRQERKVGNWSKAVHILYIKASLSREISVLTRETNFTYWLISAHSFCLLFEYSGIVNIL